MLVLRISNTKQLSSQPFKVGSKLFPSSKLFDHRVKAFPVTVTSILFGHGSLHGSPVQVFQLVNVGVCGHADFGPGTVVVESGINGQVL
jgi:hypothetical protein